MNDWKGCILLIVFYGSMLVGIFAESGLLRTICICITIVGVIIGLIGHFGGMKNNRDYPDYDGDGQP